MPTIEEALQIGWKQHQAGNLRGAEDIYRQVLNVAPTNENAWCFLGMACHDQGRYEEAASSYREALRIKPSFPVALSNFGNTLKQQGKYSEAEASCREALRIKPDYSTAYNNLGVVLVAQGRLEEAAATFEKSLKLAPQDAVAQANLGAALVRQGRFEEGTNIAQQALKINPNYAEAHKNQAIVWLLLGDLERGWPEYEWRWRCPGSALPNVSGTRWDGSPLAGRTILLHWEQGLGDTVQFVRYARRLKQQGARIVVCCQKPLKRLLQWCDGIDDLVAQGEPLPAFDVWTPMLSIPGVLKTTLVMIPGDVGYIVPDPELVKKWRARLAEYHGYRIGIAWQGSPDFHADRQRSFPLGFFERLARLPGVRLISLQKGFGVEQLQQLGGRFEVIDFGDELDATAPFVDTAAMMPCLDLIISADTCVPHLSGAMGLPTWVALSVSPDWRWLLNRDDTPWYPTTRLFRQKTLGDWDDVFERITRALSDRMANQEPVAVVSTTPGSAIAEQQPATPLLAAGNNLLLPTRHGLFLCNPIDPFVGRSLDLYGEYCEEELEFLVRLLEPDATVIEIAAGIGAHTVPLARHVGPAGIIHAFESRRLTFQLLCANVALNGLENVHTYERGVSQRFSNGTDTTTYPTMASAATIDALDFGNCQLIRIDAPGNEENVLAGAEQTLTRSDPVVYLRNVSESQRPRIISWFRSRGFRMYWHSPRFFRSTNFRGQTDNVFGEMKSENILCVSNSTAIDVSEMQSVTETNYE